MLMKAKTKEKSNFSIVYKKEIEWLKWYFNKDKNIPTMSLLDKKIHDCKVMNDQRGYKKFSTIKKVIENTVAISDADLLKAVKEVYVFKRMSVIGAAQSILFLGQTQAYVHVRKWFEEFEMQLFDLM